MNPSVPSWLIYLWRRAQLSRELAEEIEFHRLLKQAENSRAGLMPQAARNLSRRQMGNIAIATEDCRDMWSFVGLELAALVRSCVEAVGNGRPAATVLKLVEGGVLQG